MVFRFVPAALYPYTTHWVSTVKTPTRAQESPLDPPTPCSTRRSSQLPFLGSSTRTQSRERPCAIRVSDSELGSRIFYAQRHRRLPFCRDHRAQPRPQQARAMQGGAAFGNATGTLRIWVAGLERVRSNRHLKPLCTRMGRLALKRRRKKACVREV